MQFYTVTFPETTPTGSHREIATQLVESAEKAWAEAAANVADRSAGLISTAGAINMQAQRMVEGLPATYGGIGIESSSVRLLEALARQEEASSALARSIYFARQLGATVEYKAGA